ncbi:hypothetical protein B0H13DRAFT_1937448 [Mycena leptocephala]|nr:hypothetical protein B0H13DRAFT_1937448 [Mycena leptocephala]
MFILRHNLAIIAVLGNCGATAGCVDLSWNKPIVVAVKCSFACCRRRSTSWFRRQPETILKWRFEGNQYEGFVTRHAEYPYSYRGSMPHPADRALGPSSMRATHSWTSVISVRSSWVGAGCFAQEVRQP